MDNFLNSIINSSSNYIKNLQYLGDSDNKTLDDIFLLNIIIKVNLWGELHKISDNNVASLKKLMYLIINSNCKLDRIKNTLTDYKYSSVNSPDWNNALRKNTNVYIPVYSTLYNMEIPTKLSRRFENKSFTVEVGSEGIGIHKQSVIYPEWLGEISVLYQYDTFSEKWELLNLNLFTKESIIMDRIPQFKYTYTGSNIGARHLKLQYE